ncbi:unnamed protein product [Cyprideis torosa]|uniref:Uncharacterized protein n=1 Tax=Cyprideis torosa TaxID=163714 RepID=A0A7R8ZTS9_9CRUS|nr:unnamed protein product [Cyprideis torosa]CAG0908003.1 unnamed protein product [Cyprideis torosa]
MGEQWLAALDDAKNDKNIRAVLINAHGKAFCAGQDLKEVSQPETNPGFKTLLADRYNPLVDKIVHMPKPIVAAVQGVAAGAGANLALCCDIVLAGKSASFIQAFSAIGLVPDSGGTYFLPRLIGRARAMAYAMLGDKITAEKAEEIGMIYRCVADEQLAEEADKLIQKLAAMPTYGLALTKDAFNQSMSNDFNRQMTLEEDYQIKAANSEDYKEGVNAFLEKRKPVFTGK